MSTTVSSTLGSQTLTTKAVLAPLGFWMLMAVLAVLNGVFREIWLIPRIGSYPGHLLSTGMLVLGILVVSFLFINTIAPPYTLPQLVVIGAVWMVLTVGFEFLVGYVEGTPISVTLGQYNVLAGQVWIVVPITLFLAPICFGWYLSG